MGLSSGSIERRVERETSILGHPIRSVGTIHEGSSRQRSRQLGARSRLNATDHRPGVKRALRTQQDSTIVTSYKLAYHPALQGGTEIGPGGSSLPLNRDVLWY